MIPRDKKEQISFHRIDGGNFLMATIIDNELHTFQCTAQGAGDYSPIGGVVNSFKKHHWLSFPRRLSDVEFSKFVEQIRPEMVRSVRESRQEASFLKEINSGGEFHIKRNCTAGSDGCIVQRKNPGGFWELFADVKNLKEAEEMVRQ